MECCPKPSKPVSAVVIGGGIIGISTAVQLARRGVRVRVLEERSGEHSEPAPPPPHPPHPEVSQVASYCNGAILCNSMAASWASANIIGGSLIQLATGLGSSRL